MSTQVKVFYLIFATKLVIFCTFFFDIIIFGQSLHIIKDNSFLKHVYLNDAFNPLIASISFHQSFLDHPFLHRYMKLECFLPVGQHSQASAAAVLFCAALYPYRRIAHTAPHSNELGTPHRPFHFNAPKECLSLFVNVHASAPYIQVGWKVYHQEITLLSY